MREHQEGNRDRDGGRGPLEMLADHCSHEGRGLDGDSVSGRVPESEIRPAAGGQVAAGGAYAGR